MAVDGFTVATIIPRIRQRLRRHASAIARADYIDAIDDAQRELWKVLVLSNNGWFVVQSQNATPGNDDYFADMTAGDRDFALPANFHQMYYVDVTAASYLDTAIQFSPMSEQPYKDKRRTTTAVASAQREFLYDITSHPPYMRLAEPLHADLDGLTVTLHYVRALDKLSAADDSLDHLPIQFWPFVADNAAAQLARGLADAADLASYYEQRVMNAKPEIATAANRNMADSPTVSGKPRTFEWQRETQTGRL